MRSKWLTALLLCATSVVSSCCVFADLDAAFNWQFARPAFNWAHDEHHWRIDAEQDVVEWIEITHGLCDSTEEFDEHTRSVLAGARVFPPGGGFPSWDIDALAAEESFWPRELSVPVLELAPTLRVQEARLVFDDEGLPTLWRTMRFERASAWLVAFQRWMAEHWSNVGELDDSSGVPPGARLAVKAALDQRQLFKLEGNAFVLEAQVDAETARRWIERFRADPADPNLRPPAEISFDGQTLRVRFVPDESGWIGARTYSLNSPGLDHAQLQIERTPLTTSQLSFEPTSIYTQLRREAGLN